MPPEEENNANAPQEVPQYTNIAPVVQSSPPPRSKWRRFFKWFGAVLVIALLAAAAVALFNRLDKPAEPQQQQSQKKDIPLLKIGYTSGPLNTFYPGGYSNSVNFFEVNLQVFEGLVRYEDKTKIVPALATGWSNPDSSTWIFNIRPNVKFHTGRVMTAEDVKASLEAAKANPDLDLYASTIKQVDTIGSDKIKITTDGTDPILLNKLNYLFIFDTKSGKQDDPANGTGPYVLKSGTSPEESSLHLTAFDSYHQGQPSTRELELSWYEDQDEAVKDFNSGKIDITGFIDPLYVKKLGKNYPYVTDPPGTRFVRIQTLKPNSPLAKKEFRQGLEYLLDKPALIEEGSGRPASQLIPQEVPGHDPSIKSPKRDIAKAKELFTAAGYPNGATLSFISSSSQDTAEELKKQFAEGGIQLQLKDIPDFDAYLDRVDTGEDDLSMQAYSSDFLDGADLLNQLMGKNYQNPEVDKLIAESNESLDSAVRLAKLKQASKLVASDVPVLPLAYLQDTFAMNKPYVLKQDTTSTLLEAYLWKAYQK